MRSSVRATGRNRSDKARGMAFRKIIDRVLGRPGAFDVDAVTSVLRGRSQPKQTEIFRGFNSPPVDATTVAKAPPPPAHDNSATKENRVTTTKRQRTDIPAPDRFYSLVLALRERPNGLAGHRVTSNLREPNSW